MYMYIYYSGVYTSLMSSMDTAFFVCVCVVWNVHSLSYEWLIAMVMSGQVDSLLLPQAI